MAWGGAGPGAGGHGFSGGPPGRPQGGLPFAGIPPELQTRVDKVLAGEPIASVFARDPAGIKLGFESLGQAIVVADKLTEKPLPLVSHRVSQAGVEELTRPDSARTSRSPR